MNSDPNKLDVLRARAAILAQPAEVAEDTAETISVLEFRMAGQKLGVETAYVRQVAPCDGLTRIPCAPAFVAGMINLRGQIITVIDLAQFVGLVGEGESDRNAIVVLSVGQAEIGIVAGGIASVQSVALPDLCSPATVAPGLRPELLRGVTSDGLIILDAAAILTEENMLVEEDVDL